MDKIKVQLTENNPYLQELILNQQYISAEVLATEIEIVPDITEGHEVDIDEITFITNILKV